MMSPMPIASWGAPTRKSAAATSWPRATGIRATMPARMISEMPLPRPYSSICSPSHIRNKHPAVSDVRPTTQNAIGWLVMKCCWTSFSPGWPGMSALTM
jgi:hypothetical protein